MNRKEILNEAEKCICGHRTTDYGEPEDSFLAIAQLWSAYKGVQFSTLDAAIMMALLKIARMKGKGSDDCFVDLVGYAACAGEIYGQRHSEDMKELKEALDAKWNRYTDAK